MVIAGACLVGVAALLLSWSVLHRLRRLATVMLSLAAGDIAIEVPFRGERDEVGRLADVLQVFRDQAGRVMESEANLHAALESMVEAIVISSADMQVVMHNQRLVTMFDLPRRDYVGMRTNELADGRLEMDTNVVERAMRPVTMAGSLCIPSLSVWKHWKCVRVVNATRATFSGDCRLDRRRGNVVGADLVRRTSHDLHSRQNACGNQTPYRVVGDTQGFRRLAHGEPFATFLR
jgi:HAMP domain-containing protein